MISPFILYLWMFSCVLAWPFALSITTMGETFTPASFRQGVRLAGFAFAMIAMITTPFILPIFISAFTAISTASSLAGIGGVVLLWAIIHLTGVWFIIVGTIVHILQDTL